MATFPDADTRRAAEWDCTQLVNRAAILTDAARWDDLAALYSIDATMTRPTLPDAPVVGRAAILASFSARPPRTTRHVCATIVVDVETADTARATSTMLMFVAADTLPLVGGFEDHLVRVPGEGWRFLDRRGFLTFAPPAERQ